MLRPPLLDNKTYPNRLDNELQNKSFPVQKNTASLIDTNMKSRKKPFIVLFDRF
jgi:hypothetical protein